jgi:predicted NodU family carbamoyl transferase
LRTNLTENDPAELWGPPYLQLVAVDEAFKNLKGDLIGWFQGRMKWVPRAVPSCAIRAALT